MNYDGRSGEGFVVYRRTYLQDETEEGAKLFNTIDQALRYINDRLKRGSGFDGDNIEYRLFKLGIEIPLESADVVEQQPPKVTKGVKVKSEVRERRLRRKL